MSIKLRFPMLIAIMALTVALYTQFPFILLSTTNYFIHSLQPILTIVLVMYLFEKWKINEIIVPFSVGLIILTLSTVINLYN